MAQDMLEQARAIFEECTQLLEEQASAGMDGDTVRSLCVSKMDSALYAAQEALVEFRRAGNAEGRVSALEIVVQCNLGLSDSFAALMAASDELAMLKKTGDRMATSRVMDVLQNVHSARGDPHGALEVVEEWLALQKESEDLPGEAKALRVKASLKLDAGRNNEALALAGESLRICQEHGLREGEVAARRTLSRVCTKRGVVDKAPNRQEALEALQELAAAVEATDQQGWNAALKVLNETCAYSQKDVDEIMARALEKDPEGAQNFLDKQGIATGRKEKAPTTSSDAKFHVTEVNRNDVYINYRMGGLQYGPRFRCLQGYRFESSKARGTFAVLQVSEDRGCRLGVRARLESWSPGRASPVDGMPQPLSGGPASIVSLWLSGPHRTVAES
ncbi:unnamed protein product [Prorocentrum cordatum]|uniref:Uncharacterized protein n=1 Tax=Prorocentrum cordatum TaxID=2364126 RepID=A0ABN9QC76_9DINO|nr:unnamed protein product [Polarella glacialis]